MRRGTAKWILTLAALLWMAVIWWFSAKPAEVSTETSHRAGRAVAGLFVPGFESWPEEEQLKLVESIDHPVRKAAHATEYAVLGILLSAGAGFYVRRRRWLAGWGGGALYAVSDEIHQYFVPGRSCQVSDMVLDSAGVLAGVAAVWAVWRLLRPQRKDG